MTALATLQAEFLSTLFNAREPDDPRMRLYRNNALANLAGALAATYPVVRRLVGEAFFGEAARRHALSVPSTSGDLDAYGDSFAAFLAGYAPARDLPYLPDVARLEWAVHECTQAPDAAPFDPAALAGMTPDTVEGLRLALQPAVRLVASDHPVLAIWEANQPERDGTPERLHGPDRILVRRTTEGIATRLIDADEWRLLAALVEGATLAHACDAMGEGAMRLPQLLARFGAAGLLCHGAQAA